MINTTTHSDDNVLQTAVASLLEVNVEEIPEFDKYNKADMWRKLIYYTHYMGYKFNGCLYNPNWCNGKSDRIESIFGMKGVKGYFLALVMHPTDPEKNHIVIVNKKFDIVNPVVDKYKDITRFPKHEEMKFNGIKQILLINE